MQKEKILAFLFFVFCVCCDADEAVGHHVSTSVNFKMPKAWRGKVEAGVDHTDALFGVPFLRNRTIVGSVYFMTANYNQSLPINARQLEDTKFINGCQDYDIELSTNELSANKIFLVDRGGCSFTQKAIVAQSKGADAIVFVNNQCIQRDVDFLRRLSIPDYLITQLCCPDSLTNELFGCNLQNVETFLPFMSTSGEVAAQNVLIPAILVSVSDGLLTKSCLCQIRPELKEAKMCHIFSQFSNEAMKKLGCSVDVIMEIKLDTPHPSGEVQYELWMRPEAQPSFLHQFEWFSESISSKSKFRPRYIVHQPVACASADVQQDEICQNYCIQITDTQSVCYLPQNSDFNADSQLTGVQVLREVIRQHCVWEQDDEKHKGHGLPNWWKYQDKFRKNGCIGKDGDFLKKCSKDIVESLDLDVKKWQVCSKEAGQEEKDVLSTLNAKQMEMGIFTTAMIVNSRVMHFGLAADSLAQRVCDGFADHTIPKVCDCVAKVTTESDFMLCQKCIDKADCDVIDSASIAGGTGKGKPASTGLSARTFFLLLSLVGVGVILYIRREKKKMRADMRDILAEYMPLDETDFGTPIGQPEGTTLI